MITILTIQPSTELKAKLNSLSSTEFQVMESNELSKIFRHSDVIICPLEKSQLLKQADTLQTDAAVLLYTEVSRSPHHLYEIAKSNNAFSVIGSDDLSKLDSILRDAADSSSKHRSSKYGKGKVIAVTSLKGGVGKSIISYHLASFLSAHIPGKTLLIDTAVPFGSSQSFLNIHSDKSWQVLRPLLKTGKELTEQRLKSQTHQTQYGFEILPSSTTLSEPPLNPEEVRHLLDATRKEFALTIVDLSVADPSQIAEYQKEVDLTVWVMTPDPESIFQSIQLVQTLGQNSMTVVANMVETDEDKEMIKTIAKKLEIPTLPVVDYDSEAIKYHLKKFSLLSDETLLLTKQFQYLAQIIFKQLSSI